MKKLLDLLQWRYATKKMDPKQAVSDDKVEQILEAIRLTATSSGLQPYEVIVVTNTQVREKIKAIAWNQAQITDGSHLLVFAAWDNYSEARVNEYFSRQNLERKIPDSMTDGYRTRLLEHIARESEAENHHHATKQAFLAAMCAMMAAAERRIDCTPMEGFEADKVDALLDLRAQGLRSTLLLPLGYRDENNDWLLRMKKVRRDNDTFITRLD